MDIQALLINWNLGFTDLGIEADSADAKSMSGWSTETWKKLVSFLQKGVIYIDMDRNRISGLRFIDPDNYFIIHHEGATQVMILKERREISSIKERLIPTHFQEDKLSKMPRVKPRKA
jgi:hypothetical protein